MAKTWELPGAPLPGPLPGGWPLDPIHLGLRGKPLKRSILQKIFTSWFMLPDSKKYFYARRGIGVDIDHFG